ncbi:MAG: ATP-binding protein [Flavobacteriaceae bacterium]|nr:ATP-binding protein [Flavobacteriaceae bacterium]
MLNSNLKNANILIVDDQQQNIDVLIGLLDMMEYTNYYATTDPRKVADLLISFKPDIILLDLMMPYLNGFQVMEQIKPLIPQGAFLPILVLTADAKNETKQQALTNGATDFLTKPFDLIEVELRIRNLLKTLLLHQTLENQNEILEEKVKERTAVLAKTNAELIIAKNKAEESNRLKSAFLGNMSHEIRTPMNGILGFTEILRTTDLKIEKQQKYLDIIGNSCRRLLNTVTDLMDISKIEAGSVEVKLSDINIKAQLEELFNFFEPEADKKGIQLLAKNGLSDAETILKSDAIKINSIMTNVLKNAIKFTHQGSIEFGCYIQDQNFEFYIKDTGIGIPKDRQAFIFDRFVMADIEDKNVYEGSGLGLSIAKSYVDMLGGQLWVESEEGKGTTFYFTIPN